MKKIYLTELHLHTKESSSCSEIPAKEMLKVYKEKGYSTIVITDHCSKRKMERLGDISWKNKIDYVFTGFDIAKEFGEKIGLNILLGVEITLYQTDSDYLVYGIDKEFLYTNEKIYNYSLQQLHDLCQKKGYILVQAHPFRDGIELAPLQLIDGIEIYNGAQDEISRNEKARRYAMGKNKIVTSGSDFHHWEDLARGGIATTQEIKDIKQLVRILKNRKYELIEDTRIEELKIDYKFNLEDFKVMENIEHSYFPNDNITPAEEVLKWYQKNNLTCIGVRNNNNEVIACANILPLDEQTFYEIYNNQMNEADVIDTQVKRYENSKEYYLYLSSISINQNYRNNYHIITTLLRGCMYLYELLIDRNIRIIKIMADASTEHGEKICKKLLKMDYIRETSHNSKIYCMDGKNFIKSMDKIMKFLNN